MQAIKLHYDKLAIKYFCKKQYLLNHLMLLSGALTIRRVHPYRFYFFEWFH